ncbi:MAG: rRNA maturation RNase YbeY [Candidatus Nanopelagicales bacterium]
MTLTCANETAYAVDLDRLEQQAVFLLDSLQLHPAVDLSITLVNEDVMEALHIEWMDEPGATDILSFPMDELRPAVDPEPGMLGDIVMCPAFVEADDQGHGMALPDRLEFLLVHGMLHLIGYDHATQAEYDQMWARQDLLLEEWHRVRPMGERGHG